MSKRNPFLAFQALGYTRLVPIIPPDAKVSEKSTLFKRLNTPQDGRGKTPGVRNRDGLWSGFDWLPYEADDRDLERWGAMGAGVGIKTGDGLILIDADTMNEEHARTIRDAIRDQLGDMPVRVGNYPKAGYLCRVDGPFQYSRVEFGNRDERNRLLERVEILSDGRQFVAEGIHPKTKRPYTWPKELTPFDDLPVFKPEQITALLQSLSASLPAASEVIREGAHTDINQDALKGSPEHVSAAVAAIPNTSDMFPSRESYCSVGYAIKAALPDDERTAFEIFTGWCDRWQDGENDPDVVASDWARMKPPYRRGAGWLYELAERHGNGQFSTASVWFDDIPEPTNPFAELAAKQQPASDTFRLITLDDLRNRPPAEWLVERHIPKRSVGFLYSVPGAGKSFWILDIALHVASGLKEWNGDPLKADDSAMVLYLAAEGSYGFKNRIEAWIKKNGAHDALSRRFKMIEETINFMSPDDMGKLLRTVTAAQQETGARFALVIVDTVSRAMPGADENLQKDMTRFVQACDAVRDATGGAVVGVHHAGKQGDMRGSTVLLGAGDFVFRLERRKGATVGHIECEKMKDGPDGWDEPYRFDMVTLEGGETSLTVERADQTIGPGAELTPDTTASVFAAMRDAWGRGEPWAKAPQAKERYAVRRMVVDFGFDGADAETALQLWEASGLIKVELVSSDSKRRGYKVVVDAGQTVQSEGVFG
ncbi:AAA family ATPase [Agrobacterium pusense]|uniref:AAA family ATPase n=1 Tax=Agrobacterium pusense TaxID=648995 RepID=UPI00384C766B